ncbi:hypothetical protein [Nocardia arthritidis]|uniref:hypothetical protein n=1 Tax=Nocardia arthritidis TaxID=228602 RepID=UPI001FE0DF91|nr:hypothetical protein [Nocardia arthritidis]
MSRQLVRQPPLRPSARFSKLTDQLAHTHTAIISRFDNAWKVDGTPAFICHY